MSATIPDELLIDELTVERVRELFQARAQTDEPIGTDPGTGHPVFIRVGQYGPYVQLGEARKGGDKPRWVGLPKGMDAAEVTLDYALKLLSLPRTLGKDRDSGEEVRAGLGRYGPYVARSREFRSLQSPDEMFTVTLDDALALLAQEKRPRRGREALKVVGTHPETGAEIRLLKGRYGPYVTDGQVNASIPKGQDPMAVTVEEALALMAKAAERKKTRSPRGRRRTARRKG